MKVRLVKLISGEEFVAEILESDANTISCKNMIKFGMNQNGLIPLPFNPLLPKNHIINYSESHIMFITEVEKEVENFYTEQFGGIVTAPSKLIV